MKDIKWLANRLKAMEPREVLWRVQQKQLQKKELKKIYTLHNQVTEIPLNKSLSNLQIDITRLSLNWNNTDWSTFDSLDLFGVFDYEKYKNRWNAGFQTENVWPEDLFSPSIDVSQRVDIGDIRTNWELNRHFQFADLAKSYYCTGDKLYINEFESLFEDWNKHNLFLHGVEWTSAMELAIRVNSWVYAYAFLEKKGSSKNLLHAIEHGILVMTDYIMKHRARFSSANNHLIIEMYAVALVGILTGYAPWKDEALKVLSDELPRQNYEDGINKEMSLHYQSFVMEAYGLLWLLMLRNGIEIPDRWKTYLTAMAEFIADSTDDYGITMEFGDSDEGKILDLNGKIDNYYQYVLNMMSCILDRKYTESKWHENLNWIIPESLMKNKKRYIPDLVCSRKDGGYTLLRTNDRRVLIGIDHADLGFGSLAAHGHADALSFQIFIDGSPVFVDSGTYTYHFTPEDRNYFRSTAAHNTVVVGGSNQSELLGPFMWGKKVKSEIVDIYEDNLLVHVEVKTEGIYGIHKRIFDFDRISCLKITDEVNQDNAKIYFHLDPNVAIDVKDKSTDNIMKTYLVRVINKNVEFEIHNSLYSKRYCSKTDKTTISGAFNASTETRIDW